MAKKKLTETDKGFSASSIQEETAEVPQRRAARPKKPSPEKGGKSAAGAADSAASRREIKSSRNRSVKKSQAKMAEASESLTETPAAVAAESATSRAETKSSRNRSVKKSQAKTAEASENLTETAAAAVAAESATSRAETKLPRNRSVKKSQAKTTEASDNLTEAAVAGAADSAASRREIKESPRNRSVKKSQEKTSEVSENLTETPAAVAAESATSRAETKLPRNRSVKKSQAKTAEVPENLTEKTVADAQIPTELGEASENLTEKTVADAQIPTETAENGHETGFTVDRLSAKTSKGRWQPKALPKRAPFPLTHSYIEDEPDRLAQAMDREAQETGAEYDLGSPHRREDVKSLRALFAPLHIERGWQNAHARSCRGVDYRNLYPPARILERKIGEIRSQAQFEHLKEKYSGLALAAKKDLSPAVKERRAPAERRRPFISRAVFEAFLARVRAPGMMDYFEAQILRRQRESLVYWYDAPTYSRPAPGAVLRYAPPQLRTDPSNHSHYMRKHADDAPDGAPAAAMPESAPANPRIVSVLAMFDAPIRPYASKKEDRALWGAEHASYHQGRVTRFITDWMRNLDLIVEGIHGGPFDAKLAKLFVNRFERIMRVDLGAARNQGVSLPDCDFQERFGLDDAEMIILWILVAVEADNIARSIFEASWGTQRIAPQMCPWYLMQMLSTGASERSALLSCLAPSSRLVSLGLIRVTPNMAPTMALYYEIGVCEQIRNVFCGIESLSAYSALYAELQKPHFSDDTYMAPSHAKALDIIKNFAERPNISTVGNLERENLNFIPSMAFLVEGLPGSGRATLVKIIASKLGRSVIVVHTSQLTNLMSGECNDVLRSIFVDATILQAIVCLKDCASLLTDERLASILAYHLSRSPVVCALCVDLGVKTLSAIEPYITFKSKMDADLRDTAASMWRQHVGLPLSNTDAVDPDLLSQQLALQPFQIQKATKLAYYSTNFDASDRVEITNEKLERAAAVQVTKNIGNLAFVSDPEITLDDVIVSEDIMTKIQQIIGSAINRRRVLYEWGLSRRIRRGTGVIALFDGEPGTGKTHSAEAIAKALGLSLMRINIATMVDKYIGETEKNLTTIFEQARPDMQLLLFDEADSLFTKRTANVSKSNDRYSNMSINVLLQLVERYEGVSILTTNLKNAIDPAFERRITYKVYFPMPKKPERERLWRYMCPPEIKTSEPIDYEWLSELELSGGEIKNAVLTAAFRAATQGILLDSEILYDSGVSEASAAGRVMRRYDENNDNMFS